MLGVLRCDERRRLLDAEGLDQRPFIACVPVQRGKFGPTTSRLGAVVSSKSPTSASSPSGQST